MSDIKISMTSETQVEGGRQYITKEPLLEVTNELTIGQLGAVLRWMMDSGIPSATPVRVFKHKRKFYVTAAHTTSFELPSFDLDSLEF